MIRPLRPHHLLGLVRFLRRTPESELTVHTWPKVQPDAGHLPLDHLLSQTVGRAATGGRAWVAMDGSQVVGVLAARARFGGLVWDVEHLHAVPSADGEAVRLLEHLCQKAAERGARRVFVEVPPGRRGAEVSRRAAFERYTDAAVYRLSPPFDSASRESIAGRPRLRADEQGLFQLYNAVVPATVRAAEAMAYDEWSALHRGPKRWAPSLIGDRHQYVWELRQGLAGWLEIVYGQKSQYIELMVHPNYESLVDRFVGYALEQVSRKAPVYSTVRAYQALLGSALERVGFQVAGRYDVYVRQLAVRIPEPKLLPARITGG
jgi:hypothetical protein